ncbi:MAG TPA: sulfotransferase domain-containing protein [Cyclobacteriaceae bacterium]|nr:sulfotransferase domain-containing protein [Cyclobacteriaceae bacterium]
MATTKNKMPDFLVIGAGKSGTTSIDKYLNQHPQIFVPKLKEPNFFGYENTKLEDFHGNEDDIKHFQRSVTTLDAYQNLFAEAKPGQIKGETSNTYMYHKEAPDRIKYYNPDMKLIAVLRQPANRLYSRFLHLARENRLPSEDFSDCLNKNSIWWQRNDLIKEGFYYKNLSRYFELFPKENIRIYLYDEFQEKSGEIMKEIYEFLGVDKNFEPDQTIRYNESGFVKNKFFNKIIGQGGILSKYAKVLLPQGTMTKLKGSILLKRKINNLRGKNLVRPKMDPEIKKFLTLDVYHEDIINLQRLLNRDLSHWLNVTSEK